jgi:uncharacterized membrane protein YvlD (DUF360 family)
VATEGLPLILAAQVVESLGLLAMQVRPILDQVVLEVDQIHLPLFKLAVAVVLVVMLKN